MYTRHHCQQITHVDSCNSSTALETSTDVIPILGLRKLSAVRSHDLVKVTELVVLLSGVEPRLSDSKVCASNRYATFPCKEVYSLVRKKGRLFYSK